MVKVDTIKSLINAIFAYIRSVNVLVLHKIIIMVNLPKRLSLFFLHWKLFSSTLVCEYVLIIINFYCTFIDCL